MVYKGGYFNFAVYQNTINVEWCAGNESSAFGNRAAQFPIEHSIQFNGEDLGHTFVINSMDEVFQRVNIYNEAIRVMNKLIESK